MKYAIGLIVGLIVGVLFGVLLTLLLFVGVSRSKTLPGANVKPPDNSSDKNSAAQVNLNAQFFNSVLRAIFKDMESPSFPLQASSQNRGDAGPGNASFALQRSGSCDGRVVLLPEGSGVTTQVRFVEGKITAPLAFKGSYNLFGSCIDFTGWAEAIIDLKFDEEKQTIFGQLRVENINLDGALSIVGGALTSTIQETINEHVNPIEILNAKQLSLSIPIKNSGGTLKAKVKDVRAEIKDGELRLQIFYDFKGEKG
jgi:hypothetical protein